MRNSAALEKPVRLRVPYYAQTEEFTCGPACVVMVLGANRHAKKLDKLLEFELWRETNMIGIGGADPFGMAIPLLKRGLGVTIVTERADRTFPKARFRRRVKDPEDRKLIEWAVVEQRARARKLGARVQVRRPELRDISDALASGRVPVALVHMGLVHDYDVPHWVVVTGMDPRHAWIHDPYPPKGKAGLRLTHAELMQIIDDIGRKMRAARSVVIATPLRPRRLRAFGRRGAS